MKILKWLPLAIVPALLLCTSVDFDDLDDAVNDSIPPVLLINGDKEQTINVNESYEPVTVTAFDNIDGDITDQIIDSGTVDTSVADTYKVYYSVSDLASNTTIDSIVVIVKELIIVDNEPPILSINVTGDDTTITLGDSWTNPTATAYDSVDGDLTDSIKIQGDTVDNFKVGSYKLIYVVSDSSGNTAKDSFVVNVENTIVGKMPQLILKGEDSLAIALGGVFVDPGFIVIDEDSVTLADDIANKVVAKTVLDSNGTELPANTVLGQTEGLFKVRYVLTLNSKTVVKYRTINVTNDDITPPVIHILGNDPRTVWSTDAAKYVDIDTGALAGVVAIDNGTDTVPVTKIDSVNMGVAGTYKIYYSASDTNGNTADTFRVVIVQIDSISPVISISKKIDTIDVGETWDSVTVTASDNADGDITSSITSTGSVNNTQKGINKIVYTVTDANNNSSKDSVEVYVFDLPTISLNGSDPDTVILNAASYHDSGATVTDNIDFVDTVFALDANTLNLTVEGVDTIHYFYQDADGNATDTIERVVVVFDIPDTEAPVITIPDPNPDTIWVGDSYTIPTATATDNKDASVTVTHSGTVDTSKAGEYTITFSATDAANNTGTADLIVVVKADTEAPVVTIPDPNPDTIWVGDSYTLPTVTANDSKDGDVAVTHSGTVDTSKAGEYTITFSATDAANNTGTADLIVVVKADTEAPVVTIPDPNPDTIWVNDSYTIPTATATDNKDVSVTVTHSGAVDTALAGEYTITFSATDAAGNTGTADLKVVVKGVGDSLVIENFEGTEKGQITLYDDNTAANESFGWWYLYHNDGSSIEPLPTGTGDTITSKVVESAKKNGTNGMHATYKLAGSGDLYATMAFDLKDGNYYNLSDLKRISFWAKGTGTIRINLVTKWVTDSATWGHFGVDVPLTTEWKEHLINIDEIVPEKWSPAAEADKKWSDADVGDKVKTVEFSVSSDAATEVNFTLDDFKFYGVTTIAP